METHSSHNAMVKSTTIYIQKDEAYRTHIENIGDDKLFFYSAYQQAISCTKIIVNNTRLFHAVHEIENKRKDYECADDCLPMIRGSNPLRMKGYPNNIIAFSAHRGHGKTSAMLSYSKALEGKLCPIEGAHFQVLDAIDPTTLEEKDSIIRTIISQMFRTFREKCEKYWNHQDLRASQQELVRKFRDCYRLAELQKSPQKISDSYDDLELLSDHGDSSNLKQKLHDLVIDYLKFMRKKEDSSDQSKLFLVLQIDDTDMNCRSAYEVVDDIRKYFVMPNVLILFATDVEQLSISVEKHFVESYEPLLRGISEQDQASQVAAIHYRKRCRKNAASYLDKLIPGMQRITLPDLDAELRDPMRKVLICFDSGKQPLEKDPPEYQQFLIDEINRKTSLRIKPDPSGRHPFLPKRMRELNHFLFMLDSMKDASVSTKDMLSWTTGVIPVDAEKKEKLLRLQRNLETLSDYFLNDWCDLHLTSPQYKSVMEDIQREVASQKISAAGASIQKNFSSDRMLRIVSNHHWDALVQYIDVFYTKHNPDDRDFAFALEMYFMLYTKLVMIRDCIDQIDRRNDHA